uniref:Uncharacterized protein n=1 Tax=Pseudomonas phage vB_PaeM_FBPa36 TaxID=3231237 RepID=A0AAU8KSW1_9VIRU
MTSEVEQNESEAMNSMLLKRIHMLEVTVRNLTKHARVADEAFQQLVKVKAEETATFNIRVSRVLADILCNMGESIRHEVDDAMRAISGDTKPVFSLVEVDGVNQKEHMESVIVRKGGDKGYMFATVGTPNKFTTENCDALIDYLNSNPQLMENKEEARFNIITTLTKQQIEQVMGKEDGNSGTEH